MTEKRCPLSYEILTNNERYSAAGLKKLHPKLNDLLILPFTPQQLRVEAAQRADKMSIQGVQPKLSARLNIKESCFDIVDCDGKFILKPPLDAYIQVPENEDFTMRLAATVNIETPLHGLLYNSDNSLTYFIKRFDRVAYHQKLCVEDFAQLSGHKRDVKYNTSMEKVVAVIDKFCTFPLLEKQKFFTRVLFCFFTGIEDMHLKNFSLITRQQKIELAPAYDLLNTTLILGATKEEIALPIRGRKNNLRKTDFVDYFAKQCLTLNNQVIDLALETFTQQYPTWKKLLGESFLEKKLQSHYLEIIEERLQRFALI